MAERADLAFHNKVIDGTAMKRLISRLIDHFGMAYTSHVLDQLKTLGFQQATATSISLGIDDLLTIPSKGWLVQDAEQQSFILEKTIITGMYMWSKNYVNPLRYGSVITAVRNPQTIPAGGQNFFEYVLEFIRDLSKTQIGEEYGPWEEGLRYGRKLALDGFK
ncbi:hypothetical protein HPP92_028442 [Vanilla planifolia]|uniref:DNA-directed RNA polymerase n=1 Tax=Vanilla planifolia TaxID=51239 RepID=A0A835U2Q4_VANPL|nr:hypothetical protein HPP92_028442 [Vanilla planifolia]